MGGDRSDRGCLREVPDACDGVVSTCGREELVVGAEGEVGDASGAFELRQLMVRLDVPEVDELTRPGGRNESTVVAEARGVNW